MTDSARIKFTMVVTLTTIKDNSSYQLVIIVLKI